MTAALIALAKAYPYRLSDCSFVVEGGAVRPFAAADRRLFADRIPMLACGSNQSPDRILHKFGGACAQPLPVTCVRLEGYDSVFSAHLSRYGSAPATIHPSPGTVVGLFVNWLTAEQKHVMDETEKMNYDVVPLDAPARLEDGSLVEGMVAYVSRVGCLNVGGRPVALAAVAAEGRQFPAMTQVEMLSHCRDRLAPDTDLDTFIVETVEDAAIRERRKALLRRDAIGAR